MDIEINPLYVLAGVRIKKVDDEVKVWSDETFLGIIFFQSKPSKNMYYKQGKFNWIESISLQKANARTYGLRGYADTAQEAFEDALKTLLK